VADQRERRVLQQGGWLAIRPTRGHRPGCSRRSTRPSGPAISAAGNVTVLRGARIAADGLARSKTPATSDGPRSASRSRHRCPTPSMQSAPSATAAARSAETAAVTRVDNPVRSANSRNIPIPACDTTPCPSADTFTRETAAILFTCEVAFPPASWEHREVLIMPFRTGTFAYLHALTSVISREIQAKPRLGAVLLGLRTQPVQAGDVLAGEVERGPQPTVHPWRLLKAGPRLLYVKDRRPGDPERPVVDITQLRSIG
jgi:hypothetical protein